ncbi:MAG: LCP family protein [Methanomicrobiales archaeon]
MQQWQKIMLTAILILVLAIGVLFVLAPQDQNRERINILLLGVDARDINHPGNTDSITILSIDKETKEVAMLSIPRDARVQIVGQGVNKINSAYPHGGFDATIQTVENFLDIKIDYYILINFEEFKNIVDTLGGIYVDVEASTAAAVPELNGKSGLSKLNGEQALAYARYRFDSAGDMGRVKRHQKIIQAIIDEALKPSNLPKAPVILNQLRNNMRTNILPYDTVILEKFVQGFKLDEAKIGMVTGDYTTINGIVYLIPDEEAKEKIVTELGLRD